MKRIAKRVLRAGVPVPRFIRPVIRGLYKLGVVVCEGGVFLRKFFFVEPVLRSIAEVGKGLQADRLPYIRGKGRLVIGDNVRLSGRSCFYFMNSGGNGGVDGGRETVDGGRETVDGGQWTVDGGRETVGCGQWAVDGDGGQEKDFRHETLDHRRATIDRDMGGQQESENPKHQPATEQPDNLTTRAAQGADLPTITIGDNTFIGNGCTISCARSVKIGREVLISAGVRIHDNDGHPHDAQKRRAGGKMGDKEISEVVIGDGAWLGAGSMIMKGVEIQEDQIAGAGQSVRRSAES